MYRLYITESERESLHSSKKFLQVLGSIKRAKIDRIAEKSKMQVSKSIVPMVGRWRINTCLATCRCRCRCRQQCGDDVRAVVTISITLQHKRLNRLAGKVYLSYIKSTWFGWRTVSIGNGLPRGRRSVDVFACCWC